MKRIISAAFVCLMLVCCLCSCDLSDITGGAAKISYKAVDGGVAVTKVPDHSTMPEIVIPDEYEGERVVAISDFAAVNLENVTKITIGKYVQEIGLWALENNKHLEAIEVDDENAYFCDVDGVLYSKDMKTLLFYPPARGISDMTDADGNAVKGIAYEIPEGVETIRTKAFYKCSDIREITLPSTLKSIEEKAFFRCNISAVTLPDTLELIGKDAFTYCSGLREITIPASVKEIGDYAFYNCTSLLKIDVLSAEESLALGEKWYPTNNGLKLDGLVISFAE